MSGLLRVVRILDYVCTLLRHGNEFGEESGSSTEEGKKSSG